MKNSMKNLNVSELAREFGWRGANVLMLVLGLTLLASLETWSAWYAWASAPKTDVWAVPLIGDIPRAALIHATISAVCGLAAFVAMAFAGILSLDERPQVRGQAFGARLIALAMMLVPIGNLAGAINMDHRLAAWDAYVASPAYELDKEIVADKMADSHLKADTSLKLVPPTQAEFDPLAYAIAVFLHAMTALLAGVRLAPPITQAERDAMEKARLAQIEETKRLERNARQRERRRIKAKAAQKARPNPVLAVFSGGKTERVKANA